MDFRYLGLNRVAIEKYTQPSTDLEHTIVTGSGNDPYTALDRFGRVTRLLWQQGANDRINTVYTYDRVGNKLTQNINDPAALTSVDELYGYDELYRLTQYDRGDLGGGSIFNPTLTQDWTLDATGNWTDFIQGVTDALNQDRTHNQVNEITDITETVGSAWPTPSYDDNGNTTAMPQPANLTSSFDATWDAWNRLVKLQDGSDTVAEYGYDGLNRRIIKKIYDTGTLDETRHCYYSDQAQCLEERIDSSTDPDQQFVWGIRFVDDLVLRDRDTNGDGTLDERLYALCDPRFSIIAITDNSGTVQERYGYDGYGKARIYTAGFATRTSSNFDWQFRYTGRRADLESLLYYFRARYYHAELGRFLSRDPAGYVDGMSLYRAYFVAGGTDPSGKKCRIATRCVRVARVLGVPLGRHCGIVIDDDSGTISVDGSGGDVNILETTDPPRTAGNTGPFTNHDDKICRCIRQSIPIWNALQVERDHLRHNSNYTMKCLFKRCGMKIKWGTGVHGKPIGWDSKSDECIRWITVDGPFSGNLCTGPKKLCVEYRECPSGF